MPFSRVFVAVEARCTEGRAMEEILEELRYRYLTDFIARWCIELAPAGHARTPRLVLDAERERELDEEARRVERTFKARR